MEKTSILRLNQRRKEGTMNKITNRDKFIKECSHQSLFIEAGAGAGKSTTMVAKIVHNILSGIAPERIVAITFTNKSAEDLLIRVTAEIDKARKEATGENKEKLDKAFYSLFKMKISTIHSFCYKILSEYSFAARIPYGISLIEEEDYEKLYEKSYNQWRRTLSAEDWNKIDNISLAIDKSAENKIKDAYINLCLNYFSDMEIVDVKRIDIKPYYKFFKKFYKLFNQGIKDGFILSKTANKYNEETFINFFNIWPDYEDDEELFYLFYRDLSDALARAVKLKKPFVKSHGNYEEENKLFEDMIEDFKEQYELLPTYFYKDLNEYALKAYKYFISNKNKDIITNNELIYQTYELIKNNEEAKKQIASQYDVIYVDEFQDTDNHQIQLICDLALEIDKRKKPGDVGSLVVVGDPKQSIYRFRGADFQSYMGFKNIFTSLGKDYDVVCLPDNFRSSSIILDWVNDTYSKMNFYDGYTYEPMLYPDHHKLIDYQDNPKAIAGVYLKQLHEDKDYSKTAELVDFLVQNHYQVMKLPKGADRRSPYVWEDIKYSDFMIIFASKTHLDSCASAFAKRGIPYDITGKLEVSSILGIRELVRIIHYLLIPDEDNYKDAVEILSHHSDKPNEVLDNLVETTKELSNYGKIYYVFNHYDQFIGGMDKIDVENIQAFIYQILENIYKQDNMSAIEIMDAIFDLMTTYQSTALSVNRDSNAVKIMNAHQTKGLEANIVIYITAKETIGINNIEIMDNKMYLNSLLQHQDIKEACEKAVEEECLRKEYVISTRARQVMIFDEDIMSSKYGKRLYYLPQYPYDWNNLKDYQINEIPEDISTPINNQVEPYIKVKEGPIDINEAPLYIEITPSQLEMRKDGQVEEVDKPKNDVHRPKDNTFGTMLHRCNELYIRNPSRHFEDIVDMAMKESDCDNSYYKKYLLKCLNATKDLFTDKGWLSFKLKPEYKFYYYINKDNEPSILMNGSIDLLMIKDKEITIIDFKSDSADYQNKEQFEQLLKDNYKPQLEAYREFVTLIYPEHSININIVWYEEINDMTNAQVVDLEK